MGPSPSLFKKIALIPQLSLNPPMRGGEGRERGDREQRKTAAHSTVKKNHPPVAVMQPPFLSSGFRFGKKGLKNTHLSVKPQWNKDMWQYLQPHLQDLSLLSSELN